MVDQRPGVSAAVIELDQQASMLRLDCTDLAPALKQRDHIVGEAAADDIDREGIIDSDGRRGRSEADGGRTKLTAEQERSPQE